MIQRIRTSLHFDALWPLYIALIVQVALTVPRAASMPSGGDEALYRWEGYIQLQSWINGTNPPKLGNFTSGTPQIYPFLSFLTGSLLGARLLSLAFMLGTTVLLWLTAHRLFNRAAAIAACSLFVVIGPTAWVGSIATFDAMAFFFLALATFLATFKSWKLVLGCAGALCLANLAKYASILWDPVVVAVALIKFGWRQAGALVLSAGVALWLLLQALGNVSGLVHTTTARPHGRDMPFTVLGTASTWIGVVVVLAIVSIIIAARKKEPAGVIWLLAILALASVAAPLEQARLHTLVSLDKHADYGAWFGCLAAGYAVREIVAWAKERRAGLYPQYAAAILLIPILILGVFQFSNAVPRPNWSDKVISTVHAVAAHAHVHGLAYILTDQPELQHIVPPIAPHFHWKVARVFTVGRGSSQLTISRSYTSLIHGREARLIVLGFSRGFRTLDNMYVEAMRQSGAYRELHRGTGRVQIWVRV
jgi:hypothetical protein